MGIVWFIFGMIMGIAMWEVVKRSFDIELEVGKMLIILAWLSWIIFTGAFVITSIYEGYPRAAGVGAMVLGGIAVVASTLVRKPLATLLKN